MWAPQIEQPEALRVELDYFADCVKNGKSPFNDGSAGLRIVKMLEAADRSIKKRGELIACERILQHCAGRETGQGRKALQVYQSLRLRNRGRNQNRGVRRNPENARVGRRCKISSHTFVCEGVTIEDNVFVGHGVTFINDSYPRATAEDGALQTEKDWRVETTLVKRGASIGSGSTVLPKVVIGENAIVGAGSVVTRDVPANAIVAGNPAKVLRSIPSEARSKA